VQVATPTGGRKLRYIFGADDRTQTSSITTTYPWRTVGQVNMQGSNGNRYTCSGATVGPRAVLTAGHCVHSGPGGSGWYNVQFSAGRSCSSCNPYGTLQWSWITTYRAWVSGEQLNGSAALCQQLAQPAAALASASGRALQRCPFRRTYCGGSPRRREPLTRGGAAWRKST
jgi:hypothetical protein